MEKRPHRPLQAEIDRVVEETLTGSFSESERRVIQEHAKSGEEYVERIANAALVGIVENPPDAELERVRVGDVFLIFKKKKRL